MASAKDNIYLHDIPGDFSFNNQVAEVFPDMISRSVPIYRSILQNLPILARRYIKSNSNVYDLGCSLGDVTYQLRSALQGTDLEQVNFIAIDNSEPMLSRAELRLSNYHSKFNTEFILGDIEQIPLHNASLVVLNFVLQFISPERRYALLERIYQGLNPGGVLILSEKFLSDDEFLEQELMEMHLEFKRQNGYSELEVQRKRTALENVMILDPLSTHLKRLEQIGFQAVVWQSGFNFCSILAFKPEANK